MPKYIHYGSPKFDPKQFKQVKNCERPFVKPYSGGLWGSPIDSENGWKDWCEGECYELDRLKQSFTFDLSPKAKILEIKGMEDIKAAVKSGLMKKTGLFTDTFAPDFEKIAEKYDAILFYENGETHYPLYGWDCDTIFVLNHKVITGVKK